ncbi:MAG: hypothetical protein ABH804_01075 [archaeon]
MGKSLDDEVTIERERFGEEQRDYQQYKEKLREEGILDEEGFQTTIKTKNLINPEYFMN